MNELLSRGQWQEGGAIWHPQMWHICPGINRPQSKKKEGMDFFINITRGAGPKGSAEISAEL
jgi:hypothetical protein